jgi:hypothetical protein
MEVVAEAVLSNGPPWVGDSSFRDKAVVKAAGARWDGDNKKWAAHSEQALASLIRTGVWIPVGCSGDVAAAILKVQAARMRASKEAAAIQKQLDAERDALEGKKYTTQCVDCGAVLDSREQFGMDCSCPYFRLWKACPKCSCPMQAWGECTGCSLP